MDSNTLIAILFGMYLLWHVADLWFARRK